MPESCPRCATPRFAAFRYCRQCGHDYEAWVSVDDAPPSVPARHPLDGPFIPFDVPPRQAARHDPPERRRVVMASVVIVVTIALVIGILGVAILQFR